MEDQHPQVFQQQGGNSVVEEEGTTSWEQAFFKSDLTMWKIS